MKLGEIKLQALMLIYPSLVLEYDGDDFEEIIYGLKRNHSYSSYIASSVGSINRALTIIEQSGLSLTDTLELECSSLAKQGEYLILDLTKHKEILRIKGIYLNGEEIELYNVSNNLIKFKVVGVTDKIQIAYYRKLKRISNLTSNNLELEIGGIEEAIPYFVKADLLMGEDMDSANSSREVFDSMLKKCVSSKEEGSSFLSVYTLGGI